MAEKTFKTRVALRRDLASNYSSSFVALKGEVLFVDTSDNKLRIKVGDGSTSYSNLKFLDEENNIVNWGYLLNGKFYSDSTYAAEKEMQAIISHIYIDHNTNKVYIYSGVEYVCIDSDLPNATSSVAGIMKLYSEDGNNEDGTMTQKAITDGISDIEFAIDENDSECLVLSKPW